MATRNIVPRADNEGQLGRNNLHWLKAFIKDLELTGDMYVDPTSSLNDGVNSVLLSDVISVISGGGVGEVNTASNIGVGGTGVFKSKVGTDLQFKNITAGTGITITDDTPNNELIIASTVTGSSAIAYTNSISASEFLPVSGSGVYEEGSPDPNSVDDKFYIAIPVPSPVVYSKHFVLNIIDSNGWGVTPHAYRYYEDTLSSPSVREIVIYFYDNSIAPIDVTINFVIG